MSRGSYRARGVSALLVVWCVVMVACSSTRHVHVWNERYIVAARAQDQGDREAARGHYAQLLEHAPDDASRRLILYQLALMLEQEQRTDEALTAYRDIYDADISDEQGSRALYRAAQLIARSSGEVTALPMYHDLIVRYGDWVAAEHAVGKLVTYHTTQQGVEAALKALLTHKGDVRGKSVEGDYLMQLAHLYQQSGDLPAAQSTYAEVLAATHLQVWWDDALWERAELYQSVQAWRDALTTLEQLATTFQETSYFIGDYSSEHADQARYEMGRIYLEELGEPDEAVAQFDQFLKDFEHNRLRDDVAWMRLGALRSAGKSKRYDRELKRFMKDFPESRYVRRLNQGELP
jgi:tetratricopeptide (TPR) repeat protein